MGTKNVKELAIESGLRGAPLRHFLLSQTHREELVKERLRSWLTTQGWSCKVAKGREYGIDVVAERDSVRWVIEVKGYGANSAQNPNNFLCGLGQLLSRMDSADTKYSIAVPSVDRFRQLWDQIPRLAKERTRITCLFVPRLGDPVEG